MKVVKLSCPLFSLGPPLLLPCSSLAPPLLLPLLFPLPSIQSGALMAVVTSITYQHPDSHFYIIFLPFVPIPAVWVSVCVRVCMCDNVEMCLFRQTHAHMHDTHVEIEYAKIGRQCTDY